MSQIIFYSLANLGDSFVTYPIGFLAREFPNWTNLDSILMEATALERIRNISTFINENTCHVKEFDGTNSFYYEIVKLFHTTWAVNWVVVNDKDNYKFEVSFSSNKAVVLL